MIQEELNKKRILTKEEKREWFKKIRESLNLEKKITN